MALTALERLRLKIADRPRALLNDPVGVGDGESVQFRVRLAPVVEDSDVVLVAGVVQERDEDYTISLATGTLTFATAPTSGDAIVAGYSWVAFSDAELQDVLDRFPSIDGAALEVITWLLADADRFLKYTFGQESVDRSSARDALQYLQERLGALSGAPVGLVKADTVERETLMEPFITSAEVSP